MFNGKKTCKILKEIRSQIAAANDIELVTEECRFRGECSGTCPKCEAEVRYLEQQLHRRRMMGKAVVVAGVSMGVFSAGSSGNTLMDSPVAAPDIVSDTIGQIDVNTAKYVIEGIVSDDVEPLMMASVCVVDDRGKIVSHATTDIHGHYALGVNELPVKLRCSYIGYETQTKKVTKRNYKNIMNILLKANDTLLGEVMIVYNRFKIVDEDSNLVRKFKIISKGKTIFTESDAFHEDEEDEELDGYMSNFHHVNEKVTIKAPGYKTRKVVLNGDEKLQTIVLKRIDD